MRLQKDLKSLERKEKMLAKKTASTLPDQDTQVSATADGSLQQDNQKTDEKKDSLKKGST